MKREIGIERLYSLGQYKNIKFADRYWEVPEEYSNNPTLIDRLYYILMVTIELEYRRYLELNQRLYGLDLGEAISYLQEVQSDIYKDIQDLLTNGEINSSEQEAKNE